MATVQHVRQERVDWHPDVGRVEQVDGVSRAVQFTNYVLAVVETVLLFRFVLKLFAANPDNGFVSFVYGLTSPLLAPFRGIFASPSENGAVFETAALVAMVVYAVLAYLIVRFFFTATGSEPAESRSPDIR